MFDFKNISKYHESLAAGSVSCMSAVEHYLEKISSQKKLNAFVEVYADEAIARARELDQKRSSGAPMKKLHGVVVAIKDVICYKNHKVSAASAILKNFTSSYTASALQYLVDEEAIIIGNCNCDEFAMGSSNENSAYGKVLNALDNTKVPGGSSGGSAVAVQADMCMVSLGSDTGGSVRQPADFCGIVGLKPGYGTISRYGLIAYASSFDQIGIFAKSVNDAQLLLEVMSKTDGLDSTMDNHSERKDVSETEEKKDKKFKIAVFKDAIQHPSLDKEISGSIINTTAQLREAGHVVDDVEFDLMNFIVPAYYVLTTAEASSNLARYDGIRYGHRTEENTSSLKEFYVKNRNEGFGMEVKRRIMLGTFVLSSGYYDAYYSKAQKIRRMLMEKVSSVFKNYDMIVLPTSPTTAFTIGEKEKDPVAMYLADIFTVFANLTGIPAISVPLYKHSNRMPFGLQIMCDRKNESTMLEMAEMLMQKK